MWSVCVSEAAPKPNGMRHAGTHLSRSEWGVRLGPRYPRDSTVLQIAKPRIVPMSEDNFARAVEILAEMLMDRVKA